MPLPYNRRQLIQSAIITSILMSILSFGTSCLPSWSEHWSKQFGFTGKPAISRLTGDTMVGQSMPTASPWSYFSIRFATYNQKASGRIRVSLLSGADPPDDKTKIGNRLLAEWLIPGRQLVDNAAKKFELPNIRLNWSKGIYLIIRADPDDPAKPVTVWLDNVRGWTGPKADILTIDDSTVMIDRKTGPGHLSLILGWDTDRNLLVDLWFHPLGPASFIIAFITLWFCLLVLIHWRANRSSRSRNTPSAITKRPKVHNLSAGRNRLFILITIATASCVGLLTIELGLQFFYRYNTGRWLWQDNAFKVNYTAPVSDRRQYALQPGYHDDAVSVGDDGFRVTGGPISAKKYIVCLGDSVPFGAGVKDTSAYPSVLQMIVSRACADLSVINAGVPSYNLRQSFDRLWLDVVPKFTNINLITIQAANDISLLTQYRADYSPDKTWADIRWKPRWPRPFLYRLATLTYLDAALNMVLGDSQPEEMHKDYPADRMLANVRKVLDENLKRCAVKGWPVILMSVDPFYYQTTNQDRNVSLSRWKNLEYVIRDWGWGRLAEDLNILMEAEASSREGVYFFDTRPIFDQLDRDKLYKDWIHLSPLGAETVASELWRVMKPIIAKHDRRPCGSKIR